MRRLLAVALLSSTMGCYDVSPDTYQRGTSNSPDGQIYDLGSAEVASASSDGCADELGLQRLSWSSLVVRESDDQVLINDGEVTLSCDRNGVDFSCLPIEDSGLAFDDGTNELVVRDSWGSLSLGSIETNTSIVYECSGSDCVVHSASNAPIRSCIIEYQASYALRQ